MEDYYTHRNSSHRYSIQKIDDDGDIQLVDANGLTDEEHTKIMRVYPHGFTSHSPKDSHMISHALGGRRDMIVAMGGEHKDYRHKKLKEGDTALYNQNGDVIRIFKKQMDITHADHIKISIGTGIEKGEPGKDKDVTITVTKDNIVLTKGSSVVTIEDGKITHKADHVVIKSNKVDLGDEGGTLVGLCGGGCATKVFAV